MTTLRRYGVPALLLLLLAVARPGRLAEAAQHPLDVWAATLTAGLAAAGGALGCLLGLLLGLALCGAGLALTWRRLRAALWPPHPTHRVRG